jgi:3-oxoacyl-[acyl-carrier-protein] synthase II
MPNTYFSVHKPPAKLHSYLPNGIFLGTGVLLCMENALRQAGVRRENVNYVNAHATSTKAGDLKEYQALIRCFGQNPEVLILVLFSQVCVTLTCFPMCSLFNRHFNSTFIYSNEVGCLFFQLKLNSTKSMIGHLLGASGAVEAVATIQVNEPAFNHLYLVQ